MTTRRIVVLAAMIVCLAGLALAQDEDLPLANWSPPPYWSPGAAVRGVESSLGLVAHGQGMRAHAMNGVASPLPFIAIAPCRIVDTRVAVSDGFHQPNFIDGEARTFAFPSSPDCPGLPATPGAYSVNIQFRPMSQLSYLTAYPTGTTMPLVSTLTAGPAAWVGNAAIVPAGTSGSIDIYCQYAGRVVIDINGYYTELLPYSGSGSTSAGLDLFAVENTGAGEGIHGIASSGTGLFGESASGNGVRGVSPNGVGGLFTGHRGIQASGIDMGGSFTDGDNSGYAYVGYGDIGVAGYGNLSGGYFRDPTNSGEAYAAYGDYGMRAFGNTAGGYFKDANSSGYANIGYGDVGITAYGNTMGGSFHDANSSGYALVGVGDAGIEAHGNYYGGFFIDSDQSGYAYVGDGDRGIDARGDEMGGYFADTNNSGYASVGYGDYGIRALGNTTGGYFKDADNAAYAYVGYGSYKIEGSGSVSFVQNHPTDPGEVIVYAAPEGDEVATYTRGTARLVNGEAHVPLGETFKWVTNPDLGLTAYLTPVGGWCDLYVAEKGTSELVVRSRDGSDCSFDYMVYGLRIGFEESTVVQEKTEEAFIPSMKDHRELLARRPDLARYTALARYSAERQVLGITGALKLDRANALKVAIHEFDPAVDKVEVPRPPEVASRPEPPGREAGGPGTATITVRSASRRTDLVSTERPVTSLPVLSGDEGQDIHARSFSSPREQLATRLAVSSSVEPGDVLVVDREHPELFSRGDRSADPTVVGVVVADAGVALGAQAGEGPSAPVALSGIARCKVDASFGAILPGDLLVSSPTPGHAMREASPLPGTVVGKALESLASGKGVIRILVMLR